MSLNTIWPFTNTIIISGVGRSGTSIYGKLLGSCEDTYYLYEPSIAKYLFHVKSDRMARVIRAVVLDDYALPVAMGRAINTNCEEDSYYGHYWAQSGIKVSNRKEAIRYISERNSTLIIKTNENTPCIPYFKTILPGCFVIHINRDGNSVVGSTLRKGWYSDDWVKHHMVDYTQNHKTPSDVPWFVPLRVRDRWLKWSPISRIAFVWAYLNEIGNAKADYKVFYEQLVSNPAYEIHKLSFMLKKTDITDGHIKDIKQRKISSYPDFTPRMSKDVLPYYNKIQKAIWDLR